MKQRISEPGRERLRFYLKYTLLFGVTAILVYLPFLLSHKSFVTVPDGLTQHYNAFVYLGEYVREILRTLFVEHRLEIPLWEFGIGYGGDVVTTLAYYVLGDPFALFSVVTPESLSEYMYMLCIVLRLFCAGAAFCAFCRKMDCERFPSLVGAVVYAFCGFAILAAIRHPYFANPMIYLPLLLLGVEKIFRKESPVLYVLMVFVSAVSNFYFFYMLVLLTVLYTVFRFFFVVREHRLKNLWRFLAWFVGYALIGVLMAAVLFLPICMAFLSDSRASNHYTFDLLYSLRYYTRFPGSFVTMESPGFWTQIGMSPIVLLGLITLFLKKGKDTFWKLQFLLMTLLLLVPVAGYVFNGFGYVSNRWEFGYAFCLAFILVRTIPDFFTLTDRQKAITFGCVAGYSVLCFALNQSRTEATFAGISLLLITMVFLFGLEKVKGFRLGRLVVPAKQAAQSGILLLAVCGILVNSFYKYSIREWDYQEDYQSLGVSMKDLTDQRESAWNLIEDDGFYRIDETYQGRSFENNHALTLGQSTTRSYWSINNSNVVTYLEMNSALMRTTSNIRGLLSRTFLMPFASAKYFVCDKGQEAYVPYGYEKVGETKTHRNDTVLLYKTDNVLPLGYTVDSYVSFADYESMTLTQRQQAMLQGAVLEEEQAPAFLEEASPTFTDASLPYQVKCNEYAEYSDGLLRVKDTQAEVTLTFEAPADCELYLEFTGLAFDARNQYDYYTEEDWENINTYSRNKIDLSRRMWEKPDNANIKVTCNGVSSDITHYTPRSIYANGRTEYLFNLCYSDQGRTELTITFSQPGEYTFDSLSVISQPMTGLEEQVAAMKEDTLENVEISTNRITGNISLDADKLLCFSIPYSQGWTLLVDGEETELLQTNVMYMGVPLTAGEHQIELRYATPYLKVGMLLTGVGFAAFIVLLVCRKVRKSRKVQP